MTELPPPTVPLAHAPVSFAPPPYLQRGTSAGDAGGRAPTDRPEGSRSTGARIVRASWITVGGILAVAALGWGTYNVISLLAHEEHSDHSSFAADDVVALDIGNDNGSVTVTATDGDTVEVTADVSDGWQATDVSSRVVDGV